VIVLNKIASDVTLISDSYRLNDFERVDLAGEVLLRDLRLLKRDQMAMSAVRQLLLQYQAVHRLSDEAVLTQIAGLVRSGALEIHRKVVPIPSPGSAAQPAPSPPFPLSERRPPAKPVTQPEAATFTAALDDEALAGVLIDAADGGVPFCEECARAAAARQN
jgi:hypothetical protein